MKAWLCAHRIHAWAEMNVPGMDPCYYITACKRCGVRRHQLRYMTKKPGAYNPWRIK